jgi:hypothetical protein
MDNRTLLLIDAVINLALGVLLGAILFGIGLALLLERSRERTHIGGLGLGGAVAINLCGGIALALWLLFGDLDVPMRGQVIMWCLAGVLFAISVIEWAAWRRK